MKKIILTTVLLSTVYFAAISQNVGTGLNQTAPEIKLKSPDGETLALSELRGKVVLIDFWAAWCGPCRHENPNIVSAYHKYKDKKFKVGNGFDIYSISLDKNPEMWKKCIELDKLDWKYHVSELDGWNSTPGKAYGVQSIPANYLIDKDGKIIAKNLRGAQLHQMLESLIE